MTPASVAVPALSRLLPNRMTPSRRSVCAEQRERELRALVAALRRGASGGTGSPPSSPSRRSRRSPTPRAARRARWRACLGRIRPRRLGRRGRRPSIRRRRRRCQCARGALSVRAGSRRRTCCRGSPARAARSRRGSSTARAGRASRSASGRTAAPRTSSQPRTENRFLWVNVTGWPKSCSEKNRPLTSVIVSSTNPARDQPEQEALERQQRHRAVGVRQREPAVQPLLEAGQQQRLQRGDDEQRVGDQRDGDVQRRERIAGVGKAMGTAAGERRQRAQRRHGQDHVADGRQLGQHARESRDEDGQPRDQRQRVHERQVEPVGRQHGAHDRDRVQHQRERGHRRRGPRAAGRRAAAQPCGGAVKGGDGQVQ